MEDEIFRRRRQKDVDYRRRQQRENTDKRRKTVKSAMIECCVCLWPECRSIVTPVVVSFIYNIE